MRLWVMSDIHLEFAHAWRLPDFDHRPRFDVLIIAGDLITRMDRGVKWLLQQVPSHPIIYVAGNHEFYGTDIDRTVSKAVEAAEGTNVHVLQNRGVTIGDTTFIGATLWTDFNLFGDQTGAMAVAGRAMNDYRKIRKDNYGRRLLPFDTLIRHQQSRKYIEEQLMTASSSKRVVVTHHSPIPTTSHDNSKSPSLRAAYSSDLTGLVQQADLWIYGHTHETRDLTVGTTRVVTNARGYERPRFSRFVQDNPFFDLHCVIDI